MKIIYMFFFGLLMLACQQNRTESKSVGKDGWLKGSEQEKINEIANQLRGYDVAMVEINYRFDQLKKVENTTNWDYHQYQLEKMKTAFQNAMTRRPKRNASSQYFLDNEYKNLEDAVTKKDSVLFLKGLTIMQNGCNACHAKEKVPFIQIKK